MNNPQRGVTLIESLVALFVLSLSLIAALSLQTSLRMNGALAQDRSVALHQAQQDTEQQRSFTDMAAFDGMAGEQRDITSATGRFHLQRQVDSSDGLKTMHTTVSWQHRGASEQQVQLASGIARLAPVYSAALALPPQDRVLAVRRALPSSAHTFADGRTLFRPSANSAVAWVLNSATGTITQQCRVNTSRDLTAASLTTCEPFDARLLRGYIRFALSNTPDALQANDTPLSLTLQAGTVRCETDTVTTGGERYIAYACAVPMSGDTPSEPQLIPHGWAFGTTATTYKACRYPGAAQAPQNYLVIHGDLACPSVVPPHNGTPVATVQYQP